MKFRVIMVFGLVNILLAYSADKTEEKAIQFSGEVKNEQGKRLPYVHIVDINTANGTISDMNGIFSLVVYPGDTIWFSSVGFKRQKISIPDTVNGGFYSSDVKMVKDTVKIEQITVYPWGTYTEFKEAFLKLEISNQSKENAWENIKKIKEQIAQNNYPVKSDPELNYDYIMRDQHERNFTKGQYPTISIFNLVAWSQFFEAIKNGDFSE
ncbi:MAG: carboxypeptidase-like regulatory domain-containing protein [Bacteroidota bacterium]